MEQNGIQSKRTYRLLGGRHFGRSKIEIPTDITVDGQTVHVKVKLKTKQDWNAQTVNGEMEVSSTEKDIKTEEYIFQKNEVRNVGFTKSFLWYSTDYVQIAIAVILSFFTMGLFLLVAAAYILLFVRCQHLVITLVSGQVVRIPVTSQSNADAFLKEIR